MKKVKLIGKKFMSVGLAASLLLAAVSTNRCAAVYVTSSQSNPQGSSQQQQQSNNKSKLWTVADTTLKIGGVLLAFAPLAYYGYYNKECMDLVNYIFGSKGGEVLAEIFGEAVNTIDALGNAFCEGGKLLCSACKLVPAIGPIRFLVFYGGGSLALKVKELFNGEKKQSEE